MPKKHSHHRRTRHHRRRSHKKHHTRKHRGGRGAYTTGAMQELKQW
jgi:hypothetical protein